MKTTLIATAVLGGVLVLAGPAAAQHGHGHGHGYGHWGDGHGWGHALGHALGWDHHHHHGWYDYGYYPNYGYGYGYSYPSYGYGYPSSAFSGYSAYNPSAYAAPLPSDRARLQIIVPHPQAELTFDGTPDPMRGTVRVFEPAPLQPGYTYWYKLGVTWLQQDGRPASDVRWVSFRPGTTTVIDLTRPAPSEAIPPPAKNPSP